MSEVTILLERWRRGDEAARDRLFEQLYGTLHALASRYLARERREHTLQATALIHEVWLKLGGGPPAAAEDHSLFLSAAATAMRRILVNHAMARQAQKRGGDVARVTLFEAASVFEERAEDLLALDGALEKFARLDPRKCRIVEQRFFAGLSEAEIARMLSVSTRTVEREWRLARAWLRREIEGG